MLTVERLREILDYNPATGAFRWRGSPRWNVKAEAVAGYVDGQGYRLIRVDGRRYRASRLAWFYMTGEWPADQIDHKNGIRDDDRFDNLRDVSPAGNQQNRRLAQSSSKTGQLGVSPHCGKFRASITIDSKRRYLGSFATPEAAHAAYLKAKRRLHATCTI